MESLKASVTFQNLEELKELLQKATDQVEQLKGTLNKIEKFEPTTNVIRNLTS